MNQMLVVNIKQHAVLIRMIQALCDIFPHNKGLKSLFCQVYIEDRVVESGKSLNDILSLDVQLLLLLLDRKSVV